MNRSRFPALAAALGLLLHLLLFRSGATGPDGTLSLPLLTLLFVAELGFVVTLIGALLGAGRLQQQGLRAVPALLTTSCALLAAGFAIVGIGLWQMAR